MEQFGRNAQVHVAQNKKKLPIELKKKLDEALLVAIVEDGRSFNDFAKSGVTKFINFSDAE